MVFTNAGAQYLTWALGSQVSNGYIQCIEIGTGSGTPLVTNSTLIAGSIRVMQTGSPNFGTARKATFQGDFAATTISGMSMREFGLFASGTKLIGSCWFRDSFNPVTFDGTVESQITVTLEVLAG